MHAGWFRAVMERLGDIFSKSSEDATNGRQRANMPVTGDVLHAIVRAGAYQLLNDILEEAIALDVMDEESGRDNNDTVDGAALCKYQEIATETAVNDWPDSQLPTDPSEEYRLDAVMDAKDDESGNNILHEAALLGSLDIARLIVDRRPSLLTDRNNNGETPFFSAAANGKTEMVVYFDKKMRVSSAEAMRKEALWSFTDRRNTALHVAVIGGFYDTALKIAELYPAIIHERDADGMTALHLIAKLPMTIVPTEFLTLRRQLQSDSFHEQDVEFGFFSEFFWSCVFKIVPGFICQKVFKTMLSHTDTILESLVTELIKDDYASYKVKFTDGYVEPPLETAVRNGMLTVVEKVMSKCKTEEDYVNQQGENLLHLAIKNRQTLIFNFLIRSVDCENKLAQAIDKRGNTILHHAARCPSDDHTGVLQVQTKYSMYWEQRWFKSVEKLTPSGLCNNQNKDGETAKALYAKTHEEMLKEDDDWAKSAATSYSVVAVLVAGVASAALYAIPGGPNQDTGNPLLRDNPFFLIFIISNTLSVGKSFYSLLLFLMVLGRRRRISFSKTSLAIVQEGVSVLYNAILFMLLAYISTVILYARSSIIGWKIAFVLACGFLQCLILFARRVGKASLSAVRWYFS